jgi:mersacidin/lichenicidin family type 2 lantibiotic
MSSLDIVRAWKDAEYRQSLSAAEQVLLPEHPAGGIELTDEELNGVDGAGTAANFTWGCCVYTANFYCIVSVDSCIVPMPG